ncbi:MAG TPA: NUDIX domain-containing protein [Rhodopila sp.]|uniref:NUDIX domain-containing protein n=1 Tax=Rhodopila sp. TaxID=2480087 RepID=UPI002C36D10F|nr:NUDIX domain-containing protein [Rhodopila sp.]HVY17469.1 NUDIX domain-containing protein [Rhodopila sp.]
MANRTPRPIPAHPDVIIDAERRAWSGRFPLDVVTFRNRRFDGALSAPHTWEVWRRGQAVAMLPYDPAADAVVLIEQFRLPALVAGLDPVLVECPAGLLEENEDPEAAMARELQEEMGLTADRMERVGNYILSAGGADEVCLLYAGRVDAPLADGAGLAGAFGLAAENEDIRVRVWPADKAIAAALAGRITNVIAALALFWLASQRDRLRAEWRTT